MNTHKTIPKVILLKLVCHDSLSSIFLQEGFRSSRNDSQCGFPYTLRSKLDTSPKGLTLLELIVALFLISLITAVVLPSFAGFGERKLKSEAREVASILRFVHDSALSRKETYWIKFDLDGNVVGWKGPEGEKTKRFDNITSITTQSTGTVSRGEVTIFIEPLGLRENISVHMGTGDENMTITINHLSGKVKIKEEL
ncbi:MAG: ral secretion pathway protein [Nitrospirae bacterium]|nr:ral secretion pathway protein [Nitrospirota bacterium]